MMELRFLSFLNVVHESIASVNSPEILDRWDCKILSNLHGHHPHNILFISWMAFTYD